MSTLRDQAYFRGGALLDVGIADTRGLLRDLPQGDQLFEITPFGDLGNYFASLDRHFYRQQGMANLFLPTLHLAGTHQLKFGVGRGARGLPPADRAARLRSAERRRHAWPAT